ncbi:hypothetical protein [Halomonas sp. MCCC 1A11062]|uniref:hypothetical protein n=1 Tax=Halomonas sp. MCCC 1A11062 TaxID=2733485 RepID=UPI001F474C23|nr:hypothetical protein [Halomonas sp. MCCC 1A11062]MCE8036402.1 hypothetical protein [Halomonas sp. MCCC 1A11062]
MSGTHDGIAPALVACTACDTDQRVGLLVLPAACCLLPAACCLLPAACCLLPAACCLLPAACCLLPAAWRVVVSNKKTPAKAGVAWWLLA